MNKKIKEAKVLITGGAGFIGSNITEYLLQENVRKVIVLDNLSTGFEKNIEAFLNEPNFEFIEGDIRNLDVCNEATKKVDFVCHQAALGSVPRSIENPIATNEVNVDGFLNMLKASEENGIKRFVYASSSSVYGDSKELPKVEENLGTPLSPYAVSKYVNELYANVFSSLNDIETIGLRYFNVFGPKQNPSGAYAAVIPKFIKKIIQNESPVIYGDGEQTRDFTYIRNVINLNLLALFSPNKDAINTSYNGGVTERTSLNEMIEILQDISGKSINPIYDDPRPGDVRDSLASISKAKDLLGYNPTVDIREGLELTYDWFKQQAVNDAT